MRCRNKAIDYLCDFVMNFPDIEDAITPAEAELLAKQLYPRLAHEPIYRMKVSPVIGTHVGPRVLGVGVLPRG